MSGKREREEDVVVVGDVSPSSTSEKEEDLNKSSSPPGEEDKLFRVPVPLLVEDLHKYIPMPPDTGKSPANPVERYVRYVPNYIQQPDAYIILLQQVVADGLVQQHEVPNRFSPTGVSTPLRRVGFFSDHVETGYQYAGVTIKAQPFGPNKLIWMRDIMDWVNDLLHTSFNGILVNYYPCPKAGLSPHSDDEASLDRDSPVEVAMISFGVTRPLRFTIGRSGEHVSTIRCQSGSLLLMLQGCNTCLMHEVPPSTYVHKTPQYPSKPNERWSLTFRKHR